MRVAQRVLSIMLFAIGGFCVGMEVMVAFMADPDPAGYAGRTAYFAGIAAAFLVVATRVTPGKRQRELGLTMLIGAGVCVGSFSTAIFLPDEKGVVMGGEMLRPYLALGAGFANLAIVVGTATLLYVRGGGGRLVRSAIGDLSVFVRASLEAIRRK